ncbi:MAG: sigma-70 family RNA polymerase sigma factor [Fuerstiella sp.]
MNFSAPDSPNSDAKLALRLQAAQFGSSAALSDLLEYVRTLLEPLAAGQLGSTLRPKQSVSDLIQETLIQIAVGFPDFQGKTVGEFRVWVARVLEHRAVDIARHFRCDKRDVSRESADPHSRIAVVSVDADSPGETVAANEQISCLISYLGKLTTEEQTLIRLRYHDGLSFETIAAQMGIPRETVRRTWYGLLERLGNCLKGFES